MKVFLWGAITYVCAIATLSAWFIFCLFMADATHGWLGGDKLWHWLAWTVFALGVVGGTSDLVKHWKEEADQ